MGNHCQSNTCLSKDIRALGDFASAKTCEFVLPALPIRRQKPGMSSYVYVLRARNRDGRSITYVGWTLDLERRLAEHNGKRAGAKTTRGRSWTLLYAEKHRTRKGAMKREYALKHDRAFRAALRGL
jgi:putative endonuclease